MGAFVFSCVHSTDAAVAGLRAAVARASNDMFDGFCRLRTLPTPITCAAHGAVLGGGMAITLLTDYVACNAAATFQVRLRPLAPCPIPVPVTSNALIAAPNAPAAGG